jgi:cellulose synthase/poly-beta-1,6-N-acetylglucosamine synthase-like glycosyltransferase
MLGIAFWLFVGLVVYVYAGYPLLVTAMARLRPRPSWPAALLPRVTLLISAYREQEAIAGKLENTLQLDYPADLLQILVAVDGADDDTRAVVESFAAQGVEMDFSPQRGGKMAAINRALPRARGDIVLFSDANNLFARDAVRELVRPFADPAVAAVTGAKRIVEGDGALGESEGLYWRYESFIKEQETRLGSSFGVVGEMLAIRRSLYEAPPDSVINDDFYLAMRLVRRGFRVIYAPGARSSEHVSATARDEVARRARIVAGRFQALTRWQELIPWNRPVAAWGLISHKFLRPLVPLFMIGALLANGAALLAPSLSSSQHPVLTLAPPVAGWLLAAQALFYLAAAAGNRLSHHAGGAKLLYLPAFLVNSNWAALKGAIRYLAGRQSTHWERVQRRD